MKQNYFPLVMKSAAVIFAVVTPVLWILHRALDSSLLLALTITAGTTCYHFAMRLSVGYLVPWIAKKPNIQHPWFRPLGFEAGLYKALKVKRWKDRMPTYAPENFSLKYHTLEEIIQNMCVSELVHEVIVIFSFVPLLFSEPFDGFWPFLITSVLTC